MKTKKEDLSNSSRIAIPLGDPAGIGIEVTLKALSSKNLPMNMQPLLVGCKHEIEKTYLKLVNQGMTSVINPKEIDIENIPFEGAFTSGQGNAKTGKASFDYLTRAVEIVLEGQARALVTAPIAKYAWHKAGKLYSGQTERLAELSQIKNPSMMFTACSPNTDWRLNTLLATTHIPFEEITKQLTSEIIYSKLDILLEFCKKFKKKPKLAIAGINPHAGEEGHLGKEEINWLIPTIKKWKQNNPEVNIYGPIPPDSCWISTAKAWKGIKTSNAPDGILALYHDQGLIPIKIIAFEHAVNTTLGLPFIRTSPDHGTGFDIAGKGIADSTSMLEAIKTAWNLSDEN